MVLSHNRHIYPFCGHVRGDTCVMCRSFVCRPVYATYGLVTRNKLT